jgi:hypothetical protein
MSTFPLWTLVKRLFSTGVRPLKLNGFAPETNVVSLDEKSVGAVWLLSVDCAELEIGERSGAVFGAAC